jgi:hypothetical protein
MKVLIRLFLAARERKREFLVFCAYHVGDPDIN